MHELQLSLKPHVILERSPEGDDVVLIDSQSGRMNACNETASVILTQLETGAEFLNRWRDLVLQTLTPAAIGRNGNRATFRDVVERSWSGHASAQSAGYRLTRMFLARGRLHFPSFVHPMI